MLDFNALTGVNLPDELLTAMVDDIDNFDYQFYCFEKQNDLEEREARAIDHVQEDIPDCAIGEEAEDLGTCVRTLQQTICKKTLLQD